MRGVSLVPTTEGEGGYRENELMRWTIQKKANTGEILNPFTVHLLVTTIFFMKAHGVKSCLIFALTSVVNCLKFTKMIATILSHVTQLRGPKK